MMAIGRRPFTVFVLLVVSVLLAGCGVLEQAQRQPPVTLKLVTLTNLSFAPFFIAQEEGYFAEQGLQVEFVKVTRSSDAVPTLASGELDVLAGTINVGLLNAMARDARISFVADKGYHSLEGCANSGLVARRALVESGELAGAAQLRGKRISLNRGSSTEFYLEKLLATVGLTIDDVTIVELPDSAQIQAMDQGAIDLMSTSEPTLSQVVQRGYGVLWMPTRQTAPGAQTAFVAYGPNLLEKDPQAGKRFMVAYIKAVRQYNQGKTERNLDILVKHTELDRQLLAQACWAAIRSDGTINPQSVLEFQAWAVQKGLLDAVVPEERFWNHEFVDYANQQLGAPAAREPG